MLSCWNLLKPVLGSARPGIRPMVEFYQKFSSRNARQKSQLGEEMRWNRGCCACSWLKNQGRSPLNGSGPRKSCGGEKHHVGWFKASPPPCKGVAGFSRGATFLDWLKPINTPLSLAMRLLLIPIGTLYEKVLKPRTLDTHPRLIGVTMPRPVRDDHMGSSLVQDRLECAANPRVSGRRS